MSPRIFDGSQIVSASIYESEFLRETAATANNKIGSASFSLLHSRGAQVEKSDTDSRHELQTGIRSDRYQRDRFVKFPRFCFLSITILA